MQAVDSRTIMAELDKVACLGWIYTTENG